MRIQYYLFEGVGVGGVGVLMRWIVAVMKVGRLRSAETTGAPETLVLK